MSKEKLFIIVGTTVDSDGVCKMRWANDLVSRIKNLDKAGHTNINLLELKAGMTKLQAAKYFLANGNLNADEMQVVEGKIAEKSKSSKTGAIKATLTSGKSTVEDKPPATDAAFVSEKEKV